MKQNSKIHIGTSGWSYKHWRKIYYPDHLPDEKWLEYYAQTFRATEINTSFYHLPEIETTRGWAKRVPKDFKFCPKISRYLTHMKKLNDPEEAMERFFDAFQPLKRKLGPVLVQLPKMVRFKPEKAEYFFKLCKSKYSYYKFALEVRHDSWLSKESIGLMKKYNIAFVISQSGVSFPYAEMATATHVYVRFHGPGALYGSGYSNAQLKKFATMFLKWEKEGREIWAFFNNDVGGWAIKDAKTLQQLHG